MGGNARAINRNTDEIIAFAEKIRFKRINRTKFTWDFIRMFDRLNVMYNDEFNIPLWDKFEHVESGYNFNGSSEFLFDKSISDSEFVAFKPLVGDIDLTIPHDRLKNLFTLLCKYEDKKITKNIKYIGQCKKWQYGHQINGVFEYYLLDDCKDNSIWVDYKTTNVQVDFEGTSYVDNKPTSFAKFAHNADWDDIKYGFKGVHHKFLLVNLVRAISINENVVILTPKSSNDPEKIRRKTLHDTPRMKAFSVDRGLRDKYAPVMTDKNKQLYIDKKPCFKDLPTSESNYITNLKSIINTLFPITDSEDFYSFLGLVNLIKQYYKEDEVSLLFDSLIRNNLFGKSAQGLARNDPREDEETKMKMVDYLCEQFPHLEFENGYEELKDEYYKAYKMVEIFD